MCVGLTVLQHGLRRDRARSRGGADRREPLGVLSPFWWEIDVTDDALKALSWAGVVWDLRTPTAWVLAGASGPPREEVAAPVA